MRNTRDAEIGKRFLYWTSFSLRDIVKQLFAKMRNTRNAKGRDPGFSISERRSRVSFWRSCAMEQTECSGRIGKRFLYWTSFSLRDIVKQLFAKMRNTRNAKGRDPGFSISERRSRVFLEKLRYGADRMQRKGQCARSRFCISKRQRERKPLRHEEQGRNPMGFFLRLSH
ncbi:unnamed protein product [Coccothraustes coccothraustes]